MAPTADAPPTPQAKDALSKRFSVRGIPMLVFLRKDGTLISTDGRALVMNDSKPSAFPWPGKTQDSAAAEGGCVVV